VQIYINIIINVNDEHDNEEVKSKPTDNENNGQYTEFNNSFNVNPSN